MYAGSERKEKEKKKAKGKRDGFDSRKLNNINDNIQILVDTDSLKEYYPFYSFLIL